MSADADAALARYVAFYTTLTPASLERLGEHFTDDARFRDPFNDARGHDAIEAVFRHMFEACSSTRFEVHECVRDGRVALLHWSFVFRLRRHEPGRERRIDGMSRVRLADDGRVCEHVDHWDAAAQVYEALPVLGAVLRWLRRRLAA